MKTIGRVFFAGLAAIVPIAFTIYVVYWLATTTGALMEPAFRALVTALSDETAAEGAPYSVWMGLGLAIAIILGVGILMQAYVVRLLFNITERILHKIPLVKTLYGSVRDLMGFFGGKDGQAMGQVVMVQLPGTPLRLIGFVTRKDFKDLPAGIGGQNDVAVYLPMSYQLGGFTAMLPRETIQPVDMTVEEAMRFAVTAGMTAKAPEESAAKG